MNKVFVSYSQRDKQFRDEILRILTSYYNDKENDTFEFKDELSDENMESEKKETTGENVTKEKKHKKLRQKR